MCRYIYTLFISALFLFCSAPVFAQQTDTIAEEDTAAAKPKKKDMAGHQLTLGVDIYRPILNQLQKDRYGYELSVSYYTRNEYYLTMEIGRGGSTVDSAYLKYETTNEFYRLGFNKSILARDNPKDWDMMFIGLGLGVADIHRGSATFVVIDTIWGNNTGVIPANSFPAYWAEIAGGVRVELVKGLFAGWTARGKFLLNRNSFSELSPLYIAGYGKGDKNTVFDINAYISYAIRWDRKKKTVIDTSKQALAPTPAIDSTKVIVPATNGTKSMREARDAKSK
ncbi:MAG: hypothetical protein JWQ38_3619 [Flavipsychrobacter sp.]|nr:hypothetical protein [Flavipsychrobacter sp.]